MAFMISRFQVNGTTAKRHIFPSVDMTAREALELYKSRDAYCLCGSYHAKGMASENRNSYPKIYKIWYCATCYLHLFLIETVLLYFF